MPRRFEALGLSQEAHGAQRTTGVGQMADARSRRCRGQSGGGVYGLPKPYLSSTAMPSGPVTNLMNAAAVALSLEPDRTAMG